MRKNKNNKVWFCNNFNRNNAGLSELPTSFCKSQLKFKSSAKKQIA